MCVIIKLDAGKTLAKDVLKTCYDNNPHGYGMMIAERKGLEFYKNSKSFDDFWRMWRQFDPNKPRAIHFRWRTHGEINKANCHPFVSPKREVGFMHNGVIQTPEVHKNMSDSYNFMVEHIVPFITEFPGAEEHPLFYQWVEKVTGSSRLLFLTPKGNFHITNEDAWVERMGCLFSNPGALTSSWRTNKNNSTTTHAATNTNTPVVTRPHLVDQFGRNYSHERNDHAYDYPEIEDGFDRETFPFDDAIPYARPPATTPSSYLHKGNIDKWEEQLLEAQELLEDGYELTEDQKEALDISAAAIASLSTKPKTLLIEQKSPIVTLTEEQKAAIADGKFEEVANAILEKGGSPTQTVGEVEDLGDDAEASDIFHTPEELGNMTEDQIDNWAEEYPEAASVAIKMMLPMLAGRA